MKVTRFPKIGLDPTPLASLPFPLPLDSPGDLKLNEISCQPQAGAPTQNVRNARSSAVLTGRTAVTMGVAYALWSYVSTLSPTPGPHLPGSGRGSGARARRGQKGKGGGGDGEGED